MTTEGNKMRKQDLPAYRTVMKSLIKFYGSVEGACKAVGISDATYYNMMDSDEITVRTARKIMAGWSYMSEVKRGLVAA